MLPRQKDETGRQKGREHEIGEDPPLLVAYFQVVKPDDATESMS